MDSNILATPLSRRGALGLGLGVTAGTLLAACSGSGGTGGGDKSSETLKFWSMPWGAPAFNEEEKAITQLYKPAEGFGPAAYQTVQWANFAQTFASAIASNTGPAISSGAGTQPFQYASQGKIAYADELIDSWRADGLYDDFIPGAFDWMKTDKGYAAVPFSVDSRVLWVNEALLNKAGVEAPTDWQSFLDACAALKKIGVYGFGTASGASFLGTQAVASIMMSNGGGLFDEGGQPNFVTPENIETTEFIIELVSKGYCDPATNGYATQNAAEQWNARRWGMGWDQSNLADRVTPEVAKEVKVADPLVSAQGKTGAIIFPAPMMMYTNTPSQKASEAFLTYYFKNNKSLWTKNTGIALPVQKSIASLPEVQNDPARKKVLDQWIPISKTWGAPGGTAIPLNSVTVDGTPAMVTFVQTLFKGKANAKAALQAFESEAKAKLPKS